MNWKQEHIFQNLCAYNSINHLQLTFPYFTFTYYDSNYNEQYHDTIMDYIEGDSLEYCLNQNYLSLKDLITIYIIISFILYIAQQKYGFIHFDLYPWNIIIKKLDSNMNYKFIIENKEYNIKFPYKITIIALHFTFVQFKT